MRWRHARLQDVTVTVLCYTLPILVQAVRELRGSGPGPATALYAAIFGLLVLASSAYSCKWPERWSPGRFDLVGNSHQVGSLWPSWASTWRSLAVLGFEEPPLRFLLVDRLVCALRLPPELSMAGSAAAWLRDQPLHGGTRMRAVCRARMRLLVRICWCMRAFMHVRMYMA